MGGIGWSGFISAAAWLGSGDSAAGGGGGGGCGVSFVNLWEFAGRT